MQLFYARTTASQNQDFFTLIHFKRWFFFSEQKENQTGMWWINDQLSPCWSNASRPKLWLYGKWLLHFSSKCLCSPAGSSAELPEGVSEVHTPSLQLLWVVGRHVGELSEDVEVRGVSWWRKKKTQNVNDGKWFEWDLIRHGEEKERKKKKSDLVFLNSPNIFYMKPLSRGAVGKKKAAVKGAEAPWSFALSTLRILSLYFSCGHGNRWIHRHDKSSWSLLCPMRAPRPG